MIEIGDYVNCVDNGFHNRTLTIGKCYKVLEIDESHDRNGKILYVIDDTNSRYGYYAFRFEMSIKSIRKNKIEKIKKSIKK